MTGQLLFHYPDLHKFPQNHLSHPPCTGHSNYDIRTRHYFDYAEFPVARQLCAIEGFGASSWDVWWVISCFLRGRHWGHNEQIYFWKGKYGWLEDTRKWNSRTKLFPSGQLDVLPGGASVLPGRKGPQTSVLVPPPSGSCPPELLCVTSKTLASASSRAAWRSDFSCSTCFLVFSNSWRFLPVSEICSVRSEISSAKDRLGLGCRSGFRLTAQALARQFKDWWFIHDIYIGDSTVCEVLWVTCRQDTGGLLHLNYAERRVTRALYSPKTSENIQNGPERTREKNCGEKYIES